MPLPNSFSYRDYVHFIRKQGPGGCFIYATLTIMEILFAKANVFPFSPTLSYAFPAYYYNHPDNKNPRLNHLEILKKFGTWPEMFMPSDYDGPTQVPNIIGFSMGTPFQLARTYKLSSWGNEEVPNKSGKIDNDYINLLKKYLYEIGPVYASLILGKDIKEGHVVAIIGYDDTKREFEYVNSYGDRWGDNGIAYISYNSFLGSTLFPQIEGIRWIRIQEHQYVPRVAMAYIDITTTLRSQVHHTYFGRNVLIVRLGLSGENTGYILWNRNNSYFKEDGVGQVIKDKSFQNNGSKVFDDSQNLRITVPVTLLPKKDNMGRLTWFVPKLYLEVENYSVNEQSELFPSVIASVNEFTIYGLHQKSQCISLPRIVSPDSIVRIENPGVSL